MKTISPYRTAVTSFSSPSPPVQSHHQHHQQQQQQQGFEYDSGDYILSIASPPSSSSPSPSHATTTTTNNNNSHVVAAALSNQSIILYDTTSGQITHRIEKAHDGPISEIAFFPWEYHHHGMATSSSLASSSLSSLPKLPLLISASRDGTIKVWSFDQNQQQQQQQQQPAIIMRLGLPKEEALSVSIGYGGTLVAVGTNKARISFFDLRYTNNTNNNNNNNNSSNNNNTNRPTGNLMGSYVDAHTEEVTRVRFQTVISPQSSPSPQTYKTILATASEDGLTTLHDPSQPSEEAALHSVLNIGTPIRDVGFFGPNYEGTWVLTGSETMSVHHWDSAQRVSDVGGDGLRSMLSGVVEDSLLGRKNEMRDGMTVEYLVGCTWASISTGVAGGAAAVSASPALHLIAGNSEGDGYVFRMDADQITPVVYLKGGHRGCIRDFCWVDDGNSNNNSNSSGGGKRLVTGGEDARLCEWDLCGSNIIGMGRLSGDGSSGRVRNQSRGGGGRMMSARAGKSSRDGNTGVVKGKKKLGSPY